MSALNQELFTCLCGDVSHQFVIGYWEDEKHKTAYLSVHLCREHNIFKRIAIAVKFIFGRRCIYGDFDEIILRPEDAPRLQKVVNYLNSID